MDNLVCSANLRFPRVEENMRSSNKVQYAVYQLTGIPEHSNKRVLAIRGTKTTRTILQDISMLDPGQVLREYLPSVFGQLDETDGWDTIREICNIAQEAADRIKPDFITGHSLGGLMSEVVSSFSRIPGFSFNCPGPVGLVNETSFLNPDVEHYRGLKFEVHLRENDPVSQVNYELHINSEPFWHPGTSHHMDDMADDIQRDFSTVMDKDAFSMISSPLLGLNHRESRNSQRKQILKFLFRRKSSS